MEIKEVGRLVQGVPWVEGPFNRGVERARFNKDIGSISMVCFTFGIWWWRLRSLLLRRPVCFHPCSLLLSLYGRERSWFPLAVVSGSDQSEGAFGRTATPLRPLQSFNRSVQLVPLLNQKRENMFCRHQADGNRCLAVGWCRACFWQ